MATLGTDVEGLIRMEALKNRIREHFNVSTQIDLYEAAYGHHICMGLEAPFNTVVEFSSRMELYGEFIAKVEETDYGKEFLRLKEELSLKGKEIAKRHARYDGWTVRNHNKGAK
jgi:hypothetical protein